MKIYRIRIRDELGEFVLEMRPRSGITIPDKSAQIVIHTLIRLNAAKELYPAQVELCDAINSKPPVVNNMEGHLKEKKIIKGNRRADYKLPLYLTCLDKEVARFLFVLRKIINPPMDLIICKDRSNSSLESLKKIIEEKARSVYSVAQVQEMLSILRKNHYVIEEKNGEIKLNFDRWLVVKLITVWAYRLNCPSLSVNPKFIFSE